MSRPDVSPSSRPARTATAVLERSLVGFRGDLTVALQGRALQAALRRVEGKLERQAE